MTERRRHALRICQRNLKDKRKCYFTKICCPNISTINQSINQSLLGVSTAHRQAVHVKQKLLVWVCETNLILRLRRSLRNGECVWYDFGYLCDNIFTKTTLPAANAVITTSKRHWRRQQQSLKRQRKRIRRSQQRRPILRLLLRERQQQNIQDINKI